MPTDDTPTPPQPGGVLRVVAWCAFGVAVATNLWGLFAPSQPGPPMFPGFDKLAHAGSFALLVLTGLLAGVAPRVLLTVVAAHAVLSEVLQATLLPGRSGDLTDVAADVIGMALGALTWLAIRRRQRRSWAAGQDPARRARR